MHKTINENGDVVEQECTKYVLHAEIGRRGHTL